ncbi:MAG: DUF2608 domain-containing protein [Puniceicoccales bacterium]|jgi:FMN phosphatase YigB (HAD superfamily)|nr:DUF2608 domain-containing protein [Puniceicoccales bacterium]
MKHTIIRTAYWSTIRKLSENFDAQTLFVWDVDGTLIYPNDIVFYPQYLILDAQDFCMECVESTRKGGVKDRQWVQNRWYQVWRSLPFALMDPSVPETIRDLQSRNICNMALTFLIVRSLEGEDFVQWRIDQLKQLGIDFSSAFGDYAEVHLEEILQEDGLEVSKEKWMYAPVYKNGVLLTHNFSKGRCLGALLKRLNFVPKRIFFVDDLEENVLSVGQLGKELGIDFMGIHYTGFEILPRADTWSEKVVRDKWEVFSRTGKWPLPANIEGVIVE